MKKEDKRKKKFRMPYGQICLWSFLAMIITFFLWPSMFYIPFYIFTLSSAMGLFRMVKMSDDRLPWYYGGGLF